MGWRYSCVNGPSAVRNWKESQRTQEEEYYRHRANFDGDEGVEAATR